LTAVCKITILYIFFFRFLVEQKRESYNILFENNSGRRTRSSAAVHANFAMGFDERATQRNWLLLSAAAAASPLSASFRHAGKCLSTSLPRWIFYTPPQWRRWNTVPAVAVMKYGSRILLCHWQFIISHLFSHSLSLSLSLPLTLTPSPFISLSLSLTLSLTHSIYLSIHLYPLLSLSLSAANPAHACILWYSHSLATYPPPTRYVCVCVWCHVFFTYTPAHPPPAVVWQRQTLLVLYNRSHWYHLMSRRRRFSSHYRLMHGRAV